METPGSEASPASERLASYLPPMLATAARAPPTDGAAWLYECKLDGYRALAAAGPGGVALVSRNGLDLGARFSHILSALRKLATEDVVLDGELAVLDEAGLSRFELLQQGHDREACFFAFDLLRWKGSDRSDLPLAERRRLLEELLDDVEPPIRLLPTVEGGGEAALREAERRGWEGILAKRRRSRWSRGRSRAWLKIKLLQSEELAVVGFTPTRTGAEAIGALLLARPADGALRYAGKVGTGFREADRRQLFEALSRDLVSTPRVSDAPVLRDARWVRPRLLAQVRFVEWTRDGVLRQPSFQGLRFDKELEEIGGDAQVRRGARRGLRTRPRFTHPQRVLYPRDGITKAELRDYYRAMAPLLLPVFRDRFLSFQHWNEGIDGPGWFHQNIDRHTEEAWMRLVTVPSNSGRRTIRRLLIEGVEGLDWLAQHSVLTVHVWSSRYPKLEEPDWVAFDLDPPDEASLEEGIAMAVEAAQALHLLLERLGLHHLVKTSGKRGLHVLLPLLPGHSHRQAIDFAVGVGRAMEQVLSSVTLERSKARRKGRLYVDCFQNGYGKTLVAPYSPRAVDGAPVSTPLLWEELRADLDPRRFNLRTLGERIAKVGDLFAVALRSRSRLP